MKHMEEAPVFDERGLLLWVSMNLSGSDPEESQQSLVGGLEHFIFSIYIYILGVIIPTD
jgi:hypothetical protein